MRCKICNSMMDKPTWNKDLNDWEVCGECLDVIFSVFPDAPERPKEDDDEDLDEDINLSTIDATSALFHSEEKTYEE